MSFEAETEAQRLSVEYEAERRASAVGRAPAALARLAASVIDEDRFCALRDAAVASVNLGLFDQANALATELIGRAHRYRNHWNYGNAVHGGHTVLGLCALDTDDVAGAIAELVRSGNTPGSPQLDTFGPSMQLACEVLLRGEFSPVLGYFEQCRKFWRMGNVWLDLWEAKVALGVIPNFVLHRYR